MILGKEREREKVRVVGAGRGVGNGDGLVVVERFLDLVFIKR